MNLELSNMKSAPPTYRIDTFGCQMNQHESEKISGMMEGIGLVPAHHAQTEDVRIINTCCIRDSAEQRIIGHIGSLKKFKTSNPRMVLAVVGCLSAQNGAADSIKRTFPFIDIILGTSDIAELPNRVCELLGIGQKKVFHDAESVIRRNAGPLAFTNVMYGCDNFCSYCIVPYVRGRERSRPAAEIVREVCELCADEYREVTLLGQNVNSYGGGGDRFAELLKRISNETAIDRIRFMTSHPKDMSNSLIYAIQTVPRVCAHVHLPVQSGSNRILKSMNRRYTREHYLGLLEALRSAVPRIVITTDIIVGYPGEEEADFQDTMSLVEHAQFDGAYTFVYSPRTGTQAASLQGQVDAHEKKRRIVELVELQNSITRQINAGYVGRNEPVLVEGPSARGNGMCGRTDGGKMVNFIGSSSLIGRTVNVRITETRGATLFGVLIDKEY